ncbi:unnamed protein product, partial [Urochloa humidicola]
VRAKTPAPSPTASLAAGSSLRPPPSLLFSSLYLNSTTRHRRYRHALDPVPMVGFAPLRALARKCHHRCRPASLLAVDDAHATLMAAWSGRPDARGWLVASACGCHARRPSRPTTRRAKATGLAPALPVVRVGEDRGRGLTICIGGQWGEREGRRHWWCCGCRQTRSCSPRAGKPSTWSEIAIHQVRDGSRKYKLIHTPHPLRRDALHAVLVPASK